MIPVGTKVAVMPNNDCDVRLIGSVGVVRTHFEGDTAGVLIDGLRNVREASGLFWFKENHLSVIQESKNETNTPSYISIYDRFSIKKVIFNGPKTIIIWKDGTKTIVSCCDGDTYDKYAGFCAAVTKKMFGTSSNIKKIIEGAVDNNKEFQEYLDSIDISKESELMRAFSLFGFK